MTRGLGIRFHELDNPKRSASPEHLGMQHRFKTSLKSTIPHVSGALDIQFLKSHAIRLSYWTEAMKMRRNSAEMLSIEKIDELIENLEKAQDKSGQSSIASSSEEAKLILQFPSEHWQEFVEYCKQNELDPARQITEAVASYYVNLLVTCRARLRTQKNSTLSV